MRRRISIVALAVLGLLVGCAYCQPDFDNGDDDPATPEVEPLAYSRPPLRPQPRSTPRTPPPRALPGRTPPSPLLDDDDDDGFDSPPARGGYGLSGRPGSPPLRGGPSRFHDDTPPSSVGGSGSGGTTSAFAVATAGAGGRPQAVAESNDGGQTANSGGQSLNQMPPLTIWLWSDPSGWCLPGEIKGVGGPLLTLPLQPPGGAPTTAGQLPPCAGNGQLPGLNQNSLGGGVTKINIG